MGVPLSLSLFLSGAFIDGFTGFIYLLCSLGLLASIPVLSQMAILITALGDPILLSVRDCFACSGCVPS